MYDGGAMILPDDQLEKLVLGDKLTDQKGIEAVKSFAKDAGISLYSALVEKDIAADEVLGEAIAKSLKVPYVCLSKLSIPEEVFRLIPERVARKRKAVVFARDNDGVKIAMANPGDAVLIASVGKKAGQKVIPHYATDRDIETTLQAYRHDLQKTVDELLKEADSRYPTNDSEDAPIARIVDELIETAYQDRASDIHIEPEEEITLIRFRIDGVLQDVLRIPNKLHDRIVTRIKVLSNLRTDEHMSAQDGKMRMELEEENLDIRVSMIPIAEGEKVVMRLLSSRAREYSLTDLGFNEHDLRKITDAFNKSYGMILSTGPTGSGKTTTIYSILEVLNTREKNITTVEDPVEYRIKGANQIQVNVKTNLTFANGLRSILRQDPNIIFVGEIRDSETAGIAVNAALTGHLVLSTLHTNDAVTAIPRLIDMKVEPYLVSSTVTVIVAQRLVRKICGFCRVSTTMKFEELMKNIPENILKNHFIPVGTNKEIRTYRGKGCKNCHFTGYRGRVGIYEVLEVSKEIRKLISERKDSDVIYKQALSEGMTSMLSDGLEKVAKGITTIEEVIRVTKVEFL